MTTTVFLRRAAAIPLTLALLPAQINWSIARTDPNQPVPIRGHAMALHEARGRAVVVAGLTDPFMSTPSTSFFEFDGLKWSSGPMPGAFPARWRTAMAYDAVTQSLILFGGEINGAGTLLADTWAMSAAGAWTLRTPAASPPARAGHTMVFDSVRNRIVLFGGIGAGGSLADTWEWDGATWNLIVPAVSPPARFFHAAAFDRRFGVTVVAGGLGGAAPFGAIGDTWTFDGVTWTLQAAVLPNGRANAVMGFDRVRRRPVLFGGDTATTGSTADTFDLVDVVLPTSAWVQRAPATTTPAVRVRHAGAELPPSPPIGSDGTGFMGHFVVVGGQSGSLVTQNPAFLVSSPRSSVQLIGAGCAGSVGIPVMRADQPIAGLVWTLTATPVPNTFASLVMGINSLLNPPVAIPGMPGCFQFATPSGSFGVVITPAGTGFVAVSAIPINPALVGVPLDAQMVIADPGVNSVGAIVTNAVRGVVGGL